MPLHFSSALEPSITEVKQLCSYTFILTASSLGSNVEALPLIFTHHRKDVH